MDEARFWRLVDVLGGTADDTSTARLAAELVEHDEVDAFGDHLDVLVAQLLAACDVPVTHDGDTAEWIAAAVIARGRDTYERRWPPAPSSTRTRGTGPRPGACSSWACRRRTAPRPATTA